MNSIIGKNSEHSSQRGSVNRSSSDLLTESFVDRLRGRDRDAWRRFLADFHNDFVNALASASSRHGYAMPPDASSRETLVVEAMAYCYEHLPKRLRSFEGEPPFRAFLSKMIQHFVLEHRRHSNSRIQLFPVIPEEPRTKDAELDGRPEILDQVWECLWELDRSYRQVVQLYHFEDEHSTLRDVSDTLTLPLETVKKRYQRGIRLIRDCVRRLMNAQHP